MARARSPLDMPTALPASARGTRSAAGQLRAPAIRFRIDPAYAPADKIARRLCLTETQFDECRPRLFARGFPQPDETTGM